MQQFNNLKTIHHYSLGYDFVRSTVEIFFRRFYREFEVRNRKNVPKNVPVIFAPNHQNALMDALAILMAVHGQLVFLARADMFRKKFFAKILHFFNIMPVFRMRDGMENLSQNDEIFEATQVVLKDRKQLCLMPEGNHGDKRKLRPLVKGIFRIAFMAQKEKGTEAHVKIIPVGIDYSDYSKYRQKLFVNFGNPIEVSEFYKQYEENPAQAMNSLRDRLSEEMSKLMIDIRSEKNYEAVMFLRTICNTEMLRRMKLKKGKLGNEHDADREMIRCVQLYEAENPDGMGTLSAKIMEYKGLIEKNNFRDWVIGKGRFSMGNLAMNWILQLLFLPVYLFGLLNNAIPYFIPIKIAAKIKDVQFQSSVLMVVGMFLFIIQFLLICIFGFIFFPYWAVVLYLVAIPLSGWAAFNYYIWFKKTVSKWRFRKLQIRKNNEAILMIELRRGIMIEIDKILRKFSNYN